MSNRPTPEPQQQGFAANAESLYCPQCGYNLRGLSANICPECGKPFSPALLCAYTTQQLQLLPIGIGIVLVHLILMAIGTLMLMMLEISVLGAPFLTALAALAYLSYRCNRLSSRLLIPPRVAAGLPPPAESTILWLTIGLMIAIGFIGFSGCTAIVMYSLRNGIH